MATLGAAADNPWEASPSCGRWDGPSSVWTGYPYTCSTARKPRRRVGDQSMRRSVDAALSRVLARIVTTEPPLAWDVQVGAQGEPDLARAEPVGERLLRCPLPERRDDVLAGQGRGVRAPELLAHQLPELARPHDLIVPCPPGSAQQ